MEKRPAERRGRAAPLKTAVREGRAEKVAGVQRLEKGKGVYLAGTWGRIFQAREGTACAKALAWRLGELREQHASTAGSERGGRASIMGEHTLQTGPTPGLLLCGSVLTFSMIF